MTLRLEGARRTLMIRISTVIGILACVGDFCMIYLLALRYPGYSHFLQAVSDLEHQGSPVARIASVGWIIMGVMFIIFGYGCYKAFLPYGKRAKTAGWMLAMYGLGEGIGSGLVPGSPGKYFQTPNGIFHSFLGGVGVLGAMLLPFIIIKLFNASKSSGLYWYSWFTTVAGMFFFILFSISNFYRPEGSWISLLGLWQRLYMLMYFLFFIYIAALMPSIKKPIQK
jgi:hypothetical protein